LKFEINRANVPIEAGMNMTTYGFREIFPDVYNFYGDKDVVL